MCLSSFFQQDYFRTDDGASLFYELHGEGSSGAVLCDGLGCDGFAWRYLLPMLKTNRRVLRWHYRGHGQSGVPPDDNRIGVPYSCADLLSLMDRAELPKAVLFGHSMGTQVALEFHRLYPQRVAGLVLLCGSFGTPLDTWHDHSMMRLVFPYLKRMVERFPSQVRAVTSRAMLTEIAYQLAVRTELNPDLISREDFTPYMHHLSRMHPLYFIRTLDSLKDHSAWDHLPQVNVPTLVVGGEIDRFTPVWLAQRMAEHIPGAEFLFVPGGSHTALLERPGMVNHAVDRFLRQRIDR
ncbi:MAG: alpha/beta hydrolase [Myxococcaceae bacterium]|nr:alpha/beta hydrolase [Myxococcaceae bacterium]